MAKITKEEALRYHAEGKPGKIEVVPPSPIVPRWICRWLIRPALPKPCLESKKNPLDAYKYTSKGNLVAVISNGTAVLGLGDIGPLAGKPVMEGKGLLFKIFAGIDVFDIEVNEKDPDKFIETVKAIAPTFGGINLEDIKAPECFKIETRLKEELEYSSHARRPARDSYHLRRRLDQRAGDRREEDRGREDRGEWRRSRFHLLHETIYNVGGEGRKTSSCATAKGLSPHIART